MNNLKRWNKERVDTMEQRTIWHDGTKNVLKTSHIFLKPNQTKYGFICILKGDIKIEYDFLPFNFIFVFQHSVYLIKMVMVTSALKNYVMWWQI